MPGILWSDKITATSVALRWSSASDASWQVTTS